MPQLDAIINSFCLAVLSGLFAADGESSSQLCLGTAPRGERVRRELLHQPHYTRTTTTTTTTTRVVVVAVAVAVAG